MNLATLRAEGIDADLQHIIDSLSLNIDAGWKKGELKRKGGKYSTSGFNACIADTKKPKLLLNEIREFFAKCKSSEITFTIPDLTAQLDIGIGVGSSEQFTASVIFSPTELQYFIDLGLELCVSAYPVSDDEDRIT